MNKIINWIKKNKLSAILIILLGFFIYRNYFRVMPGFFQTSDSSKLVGYGVDSAQEFAQIAGTPERIISEEMSPIIPASDYPPSDVKSRLVIQETSLSLVVKDVRQTTDTILNYVEDQGGYMVSTTLTQPEEAPYGTVVVRVPSLKLRETLEYFRSQSIKVASEFISGKDVTDEYVDIEAQIKTLESTKSRFEEILRDAVKIDDILRVQREIISLQSQIDNFKGRQQLLEGSAELSRVTIHLSTDEIALPYTPSETFRPNVIFKLAVRSLVVNLRKLAAAAIWLLVYSVIWLPIIGIIIFIKRFKAGRNKGL